MYGMATLDPFGAEATGVDRKIPRVIRQYSTYETLPGEIERRIAGLREANPSWDYVMYDDATARDLILAHYGRDILHYYDAISPTYASARSDLFRYLALYKLGGVYLDVKSTFTGPIDEVVGTDDAFVLSHWENGPDGEHVGWGLHEELAHIPGGEFQQWHIIAAPAHPFLRAVLNRVFAGIDRYTVRAGTGQMGVLRLTGPIPYTLAIYPLIDKYPCRLVRTETDLGLVYSVMTGKSHQGLTNHHYSTNPSPIVLRPGIGGWFDSLYSSVRKIARTLKLRCKAFSAQSAP